MKRPTIPDLAKTAGVSVSTVNRILKDATTVRAPTRQRVLQAAEDIGFYGLGSIEYAVKNNRRTSRLGVLLMAETRAFYRELGRAIVNAAAASPQERVELELDFLEDLSPEKIADQITSLGEKCEAIAIVAPQHPLVADAVDRVLEQGVPVASLIAPFTATGNVSFVGLDNWKVGRTAAWVFNKMVREPGKIGILVGNHRFRNQEMNESGFRSYFREHNRKFTLLEPLATYESAAVAHEHVERLLSENPDLCGLFISGGGVTGAIAALRDKPRRSDFVAVGYELFDETRAALIEGTLSVVISHPIEKFAQQTIQTLLKAKWAGPNAGAQRVALEFEMYSPESV